MQPTAYPDVNALLDRLLAQMQTVLGQKLVGLYLSGSLVTGDFDEGISDVDLLAAVGGDLDEAEFNALKTMHDGVVTNDPQWDNRIEIAYLSLHGLRTFKTQTSKIGIISPGEPFHIITADRLWLPNWYMVREKGVTLFGPAPQSIIEPISKEEFIQVIKEHVRGWREWVKDMYYRGSQAYAILTLCRALYTVRNGEQVSKRKAALWAQNELPAWSALIEKALLWRQTSKEDADHATTIPETQRFVNFVIDLILS